MEKILRELKLESLFPKFAAQRIEPENVSALSDEELSCLQVGVSTIGDRLRVRGLCANAEKDHPSVAANVLSERMALFSGRCRSTRREKDSYETVLDGKFHLCSRSISEQNSLVYRQTSPVPCWTRHEENQT